MDPGPENNLGKPWKAIGTFVIEIPLQKPRCMDRHRNQNPHDK